MTVNRQVVFFRVKSSRLVLQTLGKDVIPYLEKLGVSARRKRSHERLEDFRDSVMVGVKWTDTDPAMVDRLRDNNNRLVCLPCDNLVYDQTPKLDHADGVMYHSQRARDDYHHLAPQARHFVVHTHYNPQLRPMQREGFALGFVGGDTHNTLYLDELSIPILEPGVKDLGPMMQSDLYRRVSCHYSVRKSGTPQFTYKPAAKLSTAVGAGCNIVLSRDPANVEVLPDYPFYTSDDYDDVVSTIERARQLDHDWHQGLAMLDALRPKLSIEETARKYVEAFESLD